MTVRLIVDILASAGVAAALTPVAIRLAYRTDWLDKPAGWKDHGRAVPLLGGTALTTAFVLMVLILGIDLDRVAPILGGALGLWAVGTLDDRRSLSAGLRVLAEALAGLALWLGGFGWHLGLSGGVDAAATICWVVGVVNAVNLIDLMDGVASSTSAVCLLASASLALLRGDDALAAVALAAAGAALGFLPYNLSRPSRTFLGDGGSMPLGFVCAVVTMGATRDTGHVPAALLTAILLVIAPLFDMGFRITVRLRNGVSLMTAGPDSLMNRIRSRVATPHAVCALVAVTQGAVAVLAIALLRLWSDAVPLEFALVLASATAFVLWVQTSGSRDAAPEVTRKRIESTEATPASVEVG